MPRGGKREGAGRKPRVASQQYYESMEEVWGGHVKRILKAKLVEALGYDPELPLESQEIARPNPKERNDILDRLVGPAGVFHAPDGQTNGPTTFLDVLILSASPDRPVLIDGSKTKLLNSGSEGEE